MTEAESGESPPHLPSTMYVFTVVGAARCAVPAASSGGTSERLIDFTPSIPRLNGAGTAQRAVPTTVSRFAPRAMSRSPRLP
jgi:hypothetical protein